MISDADRERVVRDLTRHCGDGRLTLDELEERVGEAWAASTRSELLHALRELPPFRHEPFGATTAPPPPRVTAAAAAVAPRRTRHPAAAGCGLERLGKPPAILIALSIVFLITAHWILAAIMFAIAVPKLNRMYAKA
jgi:hypothetical protein